MEQQKELVGEIILVIIEAKELIVGSGLPYVKVEFNGNKDATKKTPVAAKGTKDPKFGTTCVYRVYNFKETKISLQVGDKNKSKSNLGTALISFADKDSSKHWEEDLWYVLVDFALLYSH